MKAPTATLPAAAPSKGEFKLHAIHGTGSRAAHEQTLIARLTTRGPETPDSHSPFVLWLDRPTSRPPPPPALKRFENDRSPYV
jgi:hypothetical protein